MRHLSTLIIFSLAFLLVSLISCSKSDSNTPTNPCANVTVQVNVTKTDASGGLANGSITASATGGSGFTYSLNGGAFQANGNFTGLAAGSYTVTAKNADGCTGSATATISNADICSTINITVNTVVNNVVPCSSPANNGSIQVNASGSTGFTYSINGGAFQSSNIFSSLAAGSYSIVAKDVNNCTKAASATVSTAPRGPQFEAARAIIRVKCAPCHMSGQASGGVSFENDCNIIGSSARIQQRSLSANPGPGGPMPPVGSTPLSDTEKSTISAWISGGGAFTN